jgi:hypothetical protein
MSRSEAKQSQLVHDFLLLLGRTFHACCQFLKSINVNLKFFAFSHVKVSTIEIELTTEIVLNGAN